MIIHREAAGTRGLSHLAGGVARRYVLGIIGAAVALVAFETRTAQADPGEGGCGKMHDWQRKEAGWLNPWENKHSSVKDVMYDPEVEMWRHVADRGNRSAPHSEFTDAYVDNVHHPVCGGGGEV